MIETPAPPDTGWIMDGTHTIQNDTGRAMYVLNPAQVVALGPDYLDNLRMATRSEEADTP